MTDLIEPLEANQPLQQESDPLVLSEMIEPGLARLTLNRPRLFNALSEEMLLALQASLDSIAGNPAIRAVILQGAGKAFCAGHDLKEMRTAFSNGSSLMISLHKMPQPVIAQVHGIATAAGCQLVAMADLAVASQEARFAVSGIHYGLFCSTPSVGLSRNILRKQAMEMLLTGDFIDAQEAKKSGLVNHVVPLEDLSRVTVTLARKILMKPEAAVRMGKQLFYAQLEMDIVQAYKLAGQTMACNMLDPDALEGLQAFVDKRKPEWVTAQRV